MTIKRRGENGKKLDLIREIKRGREREKKRKRKSEKVRKRE